MNVAIITDQHLDGRKNSQIFWEFFMKFYNDVFFPTLDKYKITTLLDLGDTFDNRKGIDFAAWSRIKSQYYDRLAERGIQVHMIVGNHTSYYKNTNKINTPELLLDSYDNINIYREVTDIDIQGTNITMLPWINSENQESVMQHLQTTKSEIVMGHLEINGFVPHPGHVFEGGLDKSVFHRFNTVFSGHFHHKSNKGNITYLGNPYEMFWSDYGDERGFHLFNLDNQKLKFFKNPYKMFKKFFYNDKKNDYTNESLTDYKNSYVKVIVEEKSDAYMFDRLIEKFYDVGIHDLKIAEDTSLFMEESDTENIEHEDTLTTLQRYIEEMKENYDKTELKSIIKSIYVEACEVQ